MNVAIDIDTIEPVIEPQKPRSSKPHNGKPIDKIEISPKGKYLVTYSEEDHSIVGWNVENIDDNQDLDTRHYCSNHDC